MFMRRKLSLVYHKVKSFGEGLSYFYDTFKYFCKYSNLNSTNDNEACMRSSVIASYHIIEKGLSMPNRRLGFGRERLLSLIKDCYKYYSLYGMNPQLYYAISIVKEYDELHKAENFQLDAELQKSIDVLVSEFPDVKPAKQEIFTKNEYFAKTKESFNIFSVSRHSMRHFSGEVSVEKLQKAVDLAKHAPSACNKQPVRVYVVTDKETVSEVLSLQQGNRGFGNDVDKVLIITTRFAECTRYSEYYMPFVDAGIFTMNLLYSLHFNNIGAIPLVWLSTKERDNKLRKLITIPNNESPAIIIGVGDVSDTIICAQSPRLETEELFIVK